jgi:RimJ/RimL family protein N-acetyltransferase
LGRATGRGYSKSGTAHRAYLEVQEGNARARNLYEACGFIYEGTYREGARLPANGRYEDLLIYGMLEHEYRARARRQD